jgi:hypothetical protein
MLMVTLLRCNEDLAASDPRRQELVLRVNACVDDSHDGIGNVGLRWWQVDRS